MADTYGRYIVIVPVVSMDLDLLTFGKRHTWLKLWEDLEELDGKIIGQQLKIFVYVDDVKHKPTKLFVSTLVDSLSEEEAYEEGIKKVEEFVSLINVFLKRGFRVLKYEVATLPVPNVRSLKEIELHVDNGYVTKIITPYGSWTILSPHFGEITHAEIFPLHFEMPKIEGKVSPKVIVMPRKELRQVEELFIRIDSLNEETRELLRVIGQLYATAVSTETISVSYLLLWEILEIYALTLSGFKPLLKKETLRKIRGLLSKEKYVERDVEKAVSWLGMLGERTETETISTIIQKELFPEKKLNEINMTIKALRKIRGAITHPKVLGEVDKPVMLEHYKKLKEIVDKLLISLSRRVAVRREA